jgi:hypothetical protein
MEAVFQNRTVLSRTLLNLYPSDIAALCRVSKSMQAVAQPALYSKIILSSITRVYQVCKTIGSSHNIGQYVTQLLFLRDEFARAQPQSTLPPDFYAAISSALANTPNLVNLVVYDRYELPSEMFQGCSTSLPFQLRELVLTGVRWDEHTHELVRSQRSLKIAKFYNAPPVTTDGDNAAGTMPIPEGAIPELEVFDGGFTVGVDIIVAKPPIRNAQMVVGEGMQRSFLSLLPRLASVSSTLLSLNINRIPEDATAKAIGTVARCCPNLRHVGIMPWSPNKVSV